MAALAESACPPGEAPGRRDGLLQDLRQHFAAELPGCTLVPFGSAVNGLWTAGSDLDLSLAAPGVEGRVECKRLLRRAGAAIHRLTGDRPEARLSASVPVLRWVPSRSGQPSCDITVNNHLAVANSELIGAYVALDGRLRPLVLAAKLWARARGINDRSRGTLSSFALSLMAVHLLQRRGGLPSLQDLAVQRGEPPREVLGVDCRYCDAAAALEASTLRAGAGEGEGEGGPGAALLAFLRHFGFEYSGGVVATRAPAAAAAGPGGARGNAFLFVENPFEPGRDVANLAAGQLVRVREEFRRAHRHLHAGGSLAELCGGAGGGGRAPPAAE